MSHQRAGIRCCVMCSPDTEALPGHSGHWIMQGLTSCDHPGCRASPLATPGLTPQAGEGAVSPVWWKIWRSAQCEILTRQTLCLAGANFISFRNVMCLKSCKCQQYIAWYETRKKAISMVSCFVFNRSFQTLNGSVFLFIITHHQV